MSGLILIHISYYHLKVALFNVILPWAPLSFSRLSSVLYTATSLFVLFSFFFFLLYSTPITFKYSSTRGPGSVVRIATGYGLDGPGIKSRCGRDFPHLCPYLPWDPPSLLYNVYRVFPGGKERPEREADPHPLLVPLVMKE